MAADASDYPTNADSIPRTNPSDNLTGHSNLHDKMADAIEEIQGFVGVSGDTTAGTLVKRVSDLEGKDFTVTFGTGSDLSGSFTVTNLGNVTNSTVAVRDDSHNHTIANVDGLQTALDGKLGSTAKAADSDKLDALNSTQFLRSDADDTTTGTLTVGGVGKYLKIKDTVSGTQAITFATADLTANRTITFPNTTGTVALTSDFSNASVNYATSAGSAGSATSANTATYATSAGSAGTVSDNSHKHGAVTRIFVQASTPSGASTNDLWIDT